MNESRALVKPYADFVGELIENLQFNANSDIGPLLEEHGQVEEEAEENEIKENDITLRGD